MTSSSIWGTGDSGEPGPQGPAGTIQIAAVTTLAPGSPATVVNVGTPENAVLNFGIPRGNPGQSIQGPPGPPGASIQGPPGNPGTKGDPGETGAAGSVILTGIGVPENTVGKNTDYYIDQVTAYMYGPKANGAWTGAYIELRPPAGIVAYGALTVTGSTTGIGIPAAVDPTLQTLSDYNPVVSIWATVTTTPIKNMEVFSGTLKIKAAGNYKLEFWASLTPSIDNVDVSFKFVGSVSGASARRHRATLKIDPTVAQISFTEIAYFELDEFVVLHAAVSKATTLLLSDASFVLTKLE